MVSITKAPTREAEIENGLGPGDESVRTFSLSFRARMGQFQITKEKVNEIHYIASSLPSDVAEVQR